MSCGADHRVPVTYDIRYVCEWCGEGEVAAAAAVSARRQPVADNRAAAGPQSPTFLNIERRHFLCDDAWLNLNSMHFKN